MQAVAAAALQQQHLTGAHIGMGEAPAERFLPAAGSITTAASQLLRREASIPSSSTVPG